MSMETFPLGCLTDVLKLLSKTKLLIFASQTFPSNHHSQSINGISILFSQPKKSVLSRFHLQSHHVYYSITSCLVSD